MSELNLSLKGMTMDGKLIVNKEDIEIAINDVTRKLQKDLSRTKAELEEAVGFVKYIVELSDQGLILSTSEEAFRKVINEFKEFLSNQPNESSEE